MAEGVAPPPPPGFQLVGEGATPPPPPGFVLDRRMGNKDIPGEQPSPAIKDNAPSMGPLVGGMEALGSVATGVGSSILGAGTGLASGLRRLVTGDTAGPSPDKVAAGVMKDMTYQPRSKEGRDIMELLSSGLDKSKLAGLGPSEAVAVQSASRMPMLQMPKVPGDKAIPAATKREPGVGAARAVDELQAQSEVRAGTQKARDLKDMSPQEAAVLERDKVTNPLRTEAFRSGRGVDPSGVVSLVRELEAKNPDAKVRGALADVRGTIERAVEGSGTASLPAAGARVTPEQLRALQGGASRMSVEMADEVRQSIKRAIDQTGDSALDSHTKALLGQVRDKLIAATPPSYQKYLSEYTRLSAPLDKFSAEGSVIGKVTTDPAAFAALNTADKQAMIEGAFKSKTPGRSLSELVRDTGNNPEASRGLRQAYTEWLESVDPKTGQAKAGDVMTKWADTREGARTSGLMTPEHIADMDKVVDSIRQSSVGGPIRRAIAGVGGAITGGMAGGHAIAGANAMRAVMESTISTKNRKALDAVFMKIAADPEGAAALIAPATPENVARVRSMLPSDAASVIAPNEARNEPVRRRRDTLSMQPAGL